MYICTLSALQQKLKAKYWVKQVDKAYKYYFLQQGGSPPDDASPSVASYWDVNTITVNTNNHAKIDSSLVDTVDKPSTVYTSTINVNTVRRSGVTQILHRHVHAHHTKDGH